MKNKNAFAALTLALSLSLLCTSARAQKVEYPVDVHMVSNAQIYLSSDLTNTLENRLDYLETLGQNSQGVTNPAILLTDGSRVAQTFKIWNSNSLSAELLSNPDFSGSADQWSLTNCTYASDAIFITSGATAYLSYTGAVSIDLYATYQLSFDLIGTGPVATISARAAGITNALSAIGTGATRVAFTVLTATNGPALVLTTTNSITVDNLSIKRMTGGDAVDAGNRTIGGDVRIRGQLQGATNMASMAQMAAEEAARVAADSNLTAAVALEATNRVTADTAINAELAAIADTYVNVAGDTQTGPLTNTVSITTTNIQSTTQTVALVIQGRDAQVAAVVGSDVIVRGGKSGGTGVGDGGDVYLLGGECTNPGDEAGTGGNVYLTAYPGTSTGGCVFIRSGLSATPPYRAYPIVFMVGTNIIAHFRQGSFDVLGGDLLSRSMYVPRLVGTYTNKNPSTVSTNNLLNGDFYLDAGSNTIVRFLNNTWKWSTLNGF